MLPLSTLDSLAWIGGHIIAGAVGVVLGLFIETLLPERFRLFLIYWGNRAKKWWRNDRYEIQISSEYKLEEPLDESEFDSKLARSIDVRSDDHGKFRFDRKTGSLDMTIEITPQYESKINMSGEVGVNQQKVSSAVVDMRVSPEYRNLTSALIDLQDIERNLLENIVSMGAKRGDAVVRCELPVKPTLQKLLGKGQIESLTGTSGEGDRITVSEEEMQIHADPKSPMTSTIKRAIVHYA